MESRIEGGCLCGNLRYRLESSPRQVCDCHCLDCRRASGAPFVTWGEVRRDRMSLLCGELRGIKHAGRLRSFAACCGTPLFFANHATTDWIDVTISSLDQPESHAPEAAIWTEDKLPWVPLDPAHKNYQQSRQSSAA